MQAIIINANTTSEDEKTDLRSGISLVPLIKSLM